MLPRLLLTGATGFVGGALALRWRERGGIVTAIVRPDSDPERVQQLQEAGVIVRVDDTIPATMAHIVAQAAPEVTLHAATRFIGEHRPEDIPPLVRDNVLFGAMLLEALSQTTAPAIVTIGTAWQQYGNALYSPQSLYAATKQAFDALATYYVEVCQARLLECLFPDVYGPGDTRRKLWWALADAARRGERLDLGDPTFLLHPLHLEDALDALEVALLRACTLSPGMAERWAVRPDRPWALADVVASFEAARGEAVPVRWWARAPRRRETREPWIVGGVLPGWKPRIGLAEGLRTLP
jgi:nucleoside-diphosphate-sugar epimerase